MLLQDVCMRSRVLVRMRRWLQEEQDGFGGAGADRRSARLQEQEDDAEAVLQDDVKVLLQDKIQAVLQDERLARWW